MREALCREVEAGDVDAAWMVTLLDLSMPSVPEDLERGRRRFASLLDQHGPEGLPASKVIRARVVGAMAEVWWNEGRFDEVADLLDLFPGDGDVAELAGRHLNERHPAVRGAEAGESWLDAVNRVYFPGAWALMLDDPAHPRIDALSSPAESYDDGPLVSVVMTSWATDPVALETAVRSVLQQSHHHLELLVVDDATPSGPVRLPAPLRDDPRVRTIELQENGGTYRARNVGVAQAQGELVAFADSDDWSHPRRIARQVSLMAEDSARQVVLAEAVFAREDLSVRDGYAAQKVAGGLSMIRRGAWERLGGFDEVRRAADSELLVRAELLGDGAVLRDADQPVGVVRRGRPSLTDGDFVNGWLHPDRAAYREGWRYWHGEIAHRREPIRLDPGGPRRFPAPARFLAESLPTARLMVLLDLARPDEAHVERLRAEVSAPSADGGVVVVSTFPMKLGETWDPAVAALVHDGSIRVVQLDDEIDVATVLVLAPWHLQVVPAVPCRVRARTVRVELGIGLRHDEEDAWRSMVLEPGQVVHGYDLARASTVLRDLFGVEPEVTTPQRNRWWSSLR
ncbi:glycosyltransferase family A protein [Aeromicrobium sp. 50.2.37]|uniref:glycosyltransferase family A protein n=1 Tax=Aeromicrobium sp. 50.2.37 TaxID=2969305 RepID=UPI00214FCEB5|nr:glycosyltransferase family A protein [Aeromicrobium sp. 50.2.37]MCR4514519.1 glycosyltransferase family 2 protein [Aeromicrobium sp. 50.2.37]